MHNEIIRQNQNGLIENPSTEIKPIHDITDLYREFIDYIDATPNTLRTYKTSIKQWMKYLADNAINQPTRQTVISFRDSLKASGHKPTTVQNYIIAVKQLFNFAEVYGLYPNIAKGVKGAKVSGNIKDQYFTAQQAKSVLDHIDQSGEEGKRNFAMLVLMFTAGLRTVEITRLNIDDLSTLGDNSVVYVQGKGKEDKTPVNIPTETEKAIRAYLAARGNVADDQPLFSSLSHRNTGKRLTTKTIRLIAKSAFRQAGFTSSKLTAHSTRHSTAMINLLNGASLLDTQLLLRHANPATTEKYLKLADLSNNKSTQRVADAIFNIAQ